MMDLYVEPDFAYELLDGILQYKLEEARLYVNSGVDCVRTGDDWGTQTSLAISPDMWRQFIKPRQEEIWSVYREAGMPIMHHSCGNIGLIMDDLVEIGLEILNPIQPLSMDIRHLAKTYGDKLVFFGGIDTQKLLPYGTPEEVTTAVKNSIKILGQGKGYIISPSQEIMTDVPLQNIHALITACQESTGYINT